jgi:sec-independent protein translocase protein TatC
LAFVATTAASFLLAQQFIDILAIPIGGTDKLISIEVTENIGAFMRVSLLSGFIIALPVIVYEIVAYVAPGLLPSEKRWLIIGIPMALVFFVSGVLFAYFVMLPAALPFLVSFIGVRTTPRISNYIEFVTNLMFWIGLSFELPLLTFLLAKLRLVNARQLAKQWRIAIIVIAVIAAFATPTPDPINMSLLMLPLFALYGLGIVFAAFARRGEVKEE